MHVFDLLMPCLPGTRRVPVRFRLPGEEEDKCAAQALVDREGPYGMAFTNSVPNLTYVRLLEYKRAPTLLLSTATTGDEHNTNEILSLSHVVSVTPRPARGGNICLRGGSEPRGGIDLSELGGRGSFEPCE